MLCYSDGGPADNLSPGYTPSPIFTTTQQQGQWMPLTNGVQCQVLPTIHPLHLGTNTPCFALAPYTSAVQSLSTLWTSTHRITVARAGTSKGNCTLP
ncbi:hypothetical protein Pelo_18145 [Pelomyxa schiedti]|nr:hypothetical protein Pelo_18145 [Pelomyxa schiedti]